MDPQLEVENEALRRRQFAQIREAFEASPDRVDLVAIEAYRSENRRDVLDMVSQFLDGSITARALASFLDQWSRTVRFGFAGPSGAMYLNQITKDATGDEIETFLRRALVPPIDEAAGCLLVDELADLTAQLREHGSAAAVARGPFFLTWFWWLQSPSTWNAMWPSSSSAMQELGWLTQDATSQGQRLSRYMRALSQLDTDSLTVEQCFAWFNKNRDSVGLDITLPERCQLAMKLPQDVPGPGSPDEEVAAYESSRQAMRAGIREMSRIGKSLSAEVSEILGIECIPNTPSEFWVPGDKHIRGDLWVSWRPKGLRGGPGLRLHVSVNGVFLVINPEVNMNPKGYGKRLLSLVPDAVDLSFFKVIDYRGPFGASMTVVGRDQVDTSFNLGLPLDIADLATAEGLRSTIARGASQLAPMFQSLCVEQSDTDPESPPTVNTSDLRALAQQFVRETEYPSDRDQQEMSLRAEWAHALAADRLSGLSKERFRRMYGNKYGNPGPQATLNATVRDTDDEGWGLLLTSVDYLLHGSDPVEQRLDGVLDDADLGFRGLKESVLLKLLAIVDPERFLPIFPFSGDNGKAALLEVLGSKAPPMQSSRGVLQVQANDAIRAITEPLFPGDPWAQAQFAYWLRDRNTSGGETGGELTDPTSRAIERLEQLAPKLYVDSEFLLDIHSLLTEMGQVILYGPPGTGKTYFAQGIAEAIAPDDDHRMLVQFHPSTTYEDFFEGFRPTADSTGGLSYTLSPGPLRLIATEAANNPDEPYVLVIDEINRANLPKVFGELLFLLEYREQSARLLYEPDEAFQLPRNLFISGTMHTVDRSVGLLDAAMRRRFHFVPFVPDLAGRSPISQVLTRWVAENDELETLPEIVDKVNNQLRALLGGDHLLLGPSYFMKAGIDEEQLRRVWRFQIEPLIEDLFFGQSEHAAQFHFDQVWAELGQPALESGSDGRP